jgi:hypothetical protein
MEQSSTSKIKLPNKELVGVKKEKDLTTEDSNKLPQPTGWRMLVLPFKMKEKTKGGVNTCRNNLRETTSCVAMWFSFENGSRLLQGQRALC